MATQGSSRVPSGRIERLLRLGTMATGVAANAAAEQARRWWSNEGGSWSASVVESLDPVKLAQTLVRIRGAAMPVAGCFIVATGFSRSVELVDPAV